MTENKANELVESILPYEKDLFLWLNGSHDVFWDSFMWIYSNKLTWIPLLIVAIGVFVYKIKWQKALILVLCMILLGLLCDQLSAGVIKPIFSRFRPTHHPNYENLVETVNNYRGGRYGFISAHAANGFGLATFVSLIYRYRYLTITLFLWATLTAYSRIYLGVHFISDIVGGALLGLLLGYLIFLLFQRLRISFVRIPLDELPLPAYSIPRAKILIGTILVLVLSIIIISFLNFLYGYHWLY